MNRAERQKKQRGTSTLEFAVVLPTLLVVFLGIMELSRAWLTVNIVTTASREGVRTGSVTPTSSGNVFVPGPALARIDAILLSANLLTGATRSVTCPTPCVNNSQVQANVQVAFNTFFPVFLSALASININRSSTMRYE